MKILVPGRYLASGEATEIEIPPLALVIARKHAMKVDELSTIIIINQFENIPKAGRYGTIGVRNLLLPIP